MMHYKLLSGPWCLGAASICIYVYTCICDTFLFCFFEFVFVFGSMTIRAGNKFLFD